MNTVRNTKRQTDTCIYDQTVTVRYKEQQYTNKEKGKEERNKEQQKERKKNELKRR